LQKYGKLSKLKDRIIYIKYNNISEKVPTSGRGTRFFGAARFVVALFGVAHFVAGPFWSEFQTNFFVCFFLFSIFLIYKKNFGLSFSIFFFKNS